MRFGSAVSLALLTVPQFVPQLAHIYLRWFRMVCYHVDLVLRYTPFGFFSFCY